MKRPYNVLVLSSSFGQGHMATARALQSAAKDNPGLNIQLEIIDFSKEVNQLFDQTSKRLYEFHTKHVPALYKMMYISTDISHTPIRLANILNYPFRQSHLSKLLRQHQPDLIISNYPIWQYLGYQISKKIFPDVEFATLITDSITVHSSWTMPDSDLYFVANTQTARSLHALGVASRKIQTLGYPVHSTFAAANFSSVAVKAKYGLRPNSEYILMSASALRAGYVRRVARAVLAALPNKTLIVVAGRDNELYEALKDDAMWKLPHSLLLGWTNDMPQLLRGSQAVITKAGGSTVMECIAAEKPLIINKIIPGQEEGNAEFVQIARLGLIATKPAEIAAGLQTIFSHYQEYEQRLSQESRPTAAHDILAFIQARLDAAS